MLSLSSLERIKRLFEQLDAIAGRRPDMAGSKDRDLETQWIKELEEDAGNTTKAIQTQRGPCATSGQIHGAPSKRKPSVPSK